MNVVPLDHHHQLSFLMRRIREGHELIVKGGKDWVDGSIMLAEALREARDSHPADVSFSQWLKQNNCNVLNADDRAALINLAADPALARMVLEKTDQRSYQHIWRNNAIRFRQATKPQRSPTGRKQREHHPGRKALHYAAKLGANTMQRIAGTSLDRHDEKEELLRLNRGAPLGELTPFVASLIEEAATGKDVSAIAAARNRVRPAHADTPGVTPLRPAPRTRDLLPAWRKRMLAPWQIADFAERLELIDYLVNSLPPDQHEAVVEHLVDNLHPTTTPPKPEPTGG
jgi:hypothetical protein